MGNYSNWVRDPEYWVICFLGSTSDFVVCQLYSTMIMFLQSMQEIYLEFITKSKSEFDI